MDIKKRAQIIKRDIPAVFIALGKKETPILAKIFAGITIGYIISPIDLIPDFIPVIGMLDDIIIVPLFLVITIKLIPKELFEKCQLESNGMLNTKKSIKWVCGFIVILLWILLIMAIILNVKQG